MTDTEQGIVMFRITGTEGAFKVCRHAHAAPISEPTVFVICMMVPKGQLCYELLSTSKTIASRNQFATEEGVRRFRDSAINWLEFLYGQWASGLFPNPEVVEMFDTVREWSATTLREIWGKDGPFTPSEIAVIDANFDAFGKQVFARLLKINTPGGPQIQSHPFRS